MKIAYLSTFYPFRGGIAQFNASLYRAMIQKGHEVHAYTFTRQYPSILFPGQTQRVTENDKADPVPAEQLLDTVNPLTYGRTARRIRSWKPDLLVMKFWMPFFAPSLGYVAGKLKKNGTAVITVLDNVIPHEKRQGDMALIRYFLKRNHAFVAMSKTVEKDLLSLKQDALYRLKPHPLYDHYGAAAEKTSALRHLRLPDDKKIILFFGFIRGYKGLDVLIEAMKELPEDIHLVIAGEVYGSFEPYRKQIDRHQLGNRITCFTRYIEDPEVPVFFSAADVCVLPYKSATQSGITQIAFHYHLPVIATNVGGLSEMIEHGATGLIIPEVTPRAVTEAVKRYFTENLLPVFSAEIKKRRGLFSWDGFADEITRLYETIQHSQRI